MDFIICKSGLSLIQIILYKIINIYDKIIRNVNNRVLNLQYSSVVFVRTTQRFI